MGKSVGVRIQSPEVQSTTRAPNEVPKTATPQFPHPLFHALKRSLRIWDLYAAFGKLKLCRNHGWERDQQSSTPSLKRPSLGLESEFTHSNQRLLASLPRSTLDMWAISKTSSSEDEALTAAATATWLSMNHSVS